MFNFNTSILAAGMLGFRAFAAQDAFAAHRLALETIFEEQHGESRGMHCGSIMRGRSHTVMNTISLYVNPCALNRKTLPPLGRSDEK